MNESQAYAVDENNKYVITKDNSEPYTESEVVRILNLKPEHLVLDKEIRKVNLNYIHYNHRDVELIADYVKAYEKAISNGETIKPILVKTDPGSNFRFTRIVDSDNLSKYVAYRILGFDKVPVQIVDDQSYVGIEEANKYVVCGSNTWTPSEVAALGFNPEDYTLAVNFTSEWYQRVNTVGAKSKTDLNLLYEVTDALRDGEWPKPVLVVRADDHRPPYYSFDLVDTVANVSTFFAYGIAARSLVRCQVLSPKMKSDIEESNYVVTQSSDLEYTRPELEDLGFVPESWEYLGKKSLSISQVELTTRFPYDKFKNTPGEVDKCVKKLMNDEYLDYLLVEPIEGSEHYRVLTNDSYNKAVAYHRMLAKYNKARTVYAQVLKRRGDIHKSIEESYRTTMGDELQLYTKAELSDKGLGPEDYEIVPGFKVISNWNIRSVDLKYDLDQAEKLVDVIRAPGICRPVLVRPIGLSNYAVVDPDSANWYWAYVETNHYDIPVQEIIKYNHDIEEAFIVESLKFNDKWQRYLRNLPEQSMGAQVVDIYLRNGMIITGVHVMNGEVTNDNRMTTLNQKLISDIKPSGDTIAPEGGAIIVQGQTPTNEAQAFIVEATKTNFRVEVYMPHEIAKLGYGPEDYKIIPGYEMVERWKPTASVKPVESEVELCVFELKTHKSGRPVVVERVDGDLVVRDYHSSNWLSAYRRLSMNNKVNDYFVPIQIVIKINTGIEEANKYTVARNRNNFDDVAALGYDAESWNLSGRVLLHYNEINWPSDCVRDDPDAVDKFALLLQHEMLKPALVTKGDRPGSCYHGIDKRGYLITQAHKQLGSSYVGVQVLSKKNNEIEEANKYVVSKAHKGWTPEELSKIGLPPEKVGSLGPVTDMWVGDTHYFDPEDQNSIDSKVDKYYGDIVRGVELKPILITFDENLKTWLCVNDDEYAKRCAYARAFRRGLRNTFQVTVQKLVLKAKQDIEESINESSIQDAERIWKKAEKLAQDIFKKNAKNVSTDNDEFGLFIYLDREGKVKAGEPNIGEESEVEIKSVKGTPLISVHSHPNGQLAELSDKDEEEGQRIANEIGNKFGVFVIGDDYESGEITMIEQWFDPENANEASKYEVDNKKKVNSDESCINEFADHLEAEYKEADDLAQEIFKNNADQVFTDEYEFGLFIYQDKDGRIQVGHPNIGEESEVDIKSVPGIPLISVHSHPNGQSAELSDKDFDEGQRIANETQRNFGVYVIGLDSEGLEITMIEQWFEPDKPVVVANEANKYVVTSQNSLINTSRDLEELGYSPEIYELSIERLIPISHVKQDDKNVDYSRVQVIVDQLKQQKPVKPLLCISKGKLPFHLVTGEPGTLQAYAIANRQYVPVQFVKEKGVDYTKASGLEEANKYVVSGSNPGYTSSELSALGFDPESQYKLGPVSKAKLSRLHLETDKDLGVWDSLSDEALKPLYREIAQHKDVKPILVKEGFPVGGHWYTVIDGIDRMKAYWLLVKDNWNKEHSSFTVPIQVLTMPDDNAYNKGGLEEAKFEGAIQVDKLPKSDMYEVVPKGDKDPLGYGNRGGKFYMDPDGRWIVVEEHDDAVREILKALGRFEDREGGQPANEDIQLLYGWKRIIDEGPGGEIQVSMMGVPPLTDHQRRELEETGRAYGRKVVLDDGSRFGKILFDPDDEGGTNEAKNYIVEKKEYLENPDPKPFLKFYHMLRLGLDPDWSVIEDCLKTLELYYASYVDWYDAGHTDFTKFPRELKIYKDFNKQLVNIRKALSVGERGIKEAIIAVDQGISQWHFDYPVFAHMAMDQEDDAKSDMWDKIGSLLIELGHMPKESPYLREGEGSNNEAKNYVTEGYNPDITPFWISDTGEWVDLEEETHVADAIRIVREVLGLCVDGKIDDYNKAFSELMDRGWLRGVIDFGSETLFVYGRRVNDNQKRTIVNAAIEQDLTASYEAADGRIRVMYDPAVDESSCYTVSTMTAEAFTLPPSPPAIIQHVEHKDVSLVAAILVGEAGGESKAGMEAVMTAIRNRAHDHHSYSDYVKVVLKPKQFSSLKDRGGEHGIIKWAQSSPVYVLAQDIVNRSLQGAIKDNIGGAKNFVTTAKWKEWEKSGFPDWVKGAHVTTTIGHHVFFRTRDEKPVTESNFIVAENKKAQFDGFMDEVDLDTTPTDEPCAGVGSKAYIVEAKKKAKYKPLLETDYAWISPVGDVFEVDMMGNHEDVARKITDIKATQQQIDNQEEPAMDKLYNDGWASLHFGMNDTFEIHHPWSPLTDFQVETLKEIGRERKRKVGLYSIKSNEFKTIFDPADEGGVVESNFVVA